MINLRTAKIDRKTNETDIKLSLNIDGTGKSDINSGCGFLDHMLTLFASHGKFDLEIKCDGDTYVDDHHTTEDIGIALGQAFSQALGDKRGIVALIVHGIGVQAALLLHRQGTAGGGIQAAREHAAGIGLDGQAALYGIVQ